MLPEDAADRRRRMVETQIETRGVRDPRVLVAMRSVPREAFVDPDLGDRDGDSRGGAYEDRPLPIACGQTISQPYVVAWMAQALELRSTDRVLEVGAGSGYAAAVMGRLAAEVWTIERHAPLVARARAALAATGAANVRVVEGDGSLGLPAHAPYDAISVACAAPRVPPALLAQLAPGGRLVLPVESAADGQDLVLLRRALDGTTTTEILGGVRFVPLVGREGRGPGTG